MTKSHKYWWNSKHSDGEPVFREDSHWWLVPPGDDAAEKMDRTANLRAAIEAKRRGYIVRYFGTFSDGTPVAYIACPDCGTEHKTTHGFERCCGWTKYKK